MSLTRTLLLSEPAPARIWSTNERLHWATRADLTRTWRGYVGLLLRSTIRRQHLAVPFPSPVVVAVRLGFKDNRRRDPHNFTGTVCKAIVDGIVDAGIVPDDTSEFLRLAEPVLHRTPAPFCEVAIRWCE